MMSDGFFCGFISFLFSPLFYSVRVSGWLMVGTWAWVQLLLSLACCPFSLPKYCCTCIAKDSSDASQTDEDVFRATAVALHSPALWRWGFLLLRPQPSLCLHMCRARNGIYFP